MTIQREMFWVQMGLGALDTECIQYHQREVPLLVSLLSRQAIAIKTPFLRSIFSPPYIEDRKKLNSLLTKCFESSRQADASLSPRQ